MKDKTQNLLTETTAENESVLEYNDELRERIAQAQNVQGKHHKTGFLIAAVIFAIGLVLAFGAARSPEFNREEPGRIAK